MPESSTTASTEADDPGVASPVPMGLYWPLWIGVFGVVTWGMMHLFGTHRQP